MRLDDGRYTALTDGMESPSIIEVNNGLFRVIGYFTIEFQVIMCKSHCNWDSVSDMSEGATLERIDK